MDSTQLILVLSIVGAALGASATSTKPAGTERPKSWFNFWDRPVVGNALSSPGQWTPGPQAGGVGGAAQGVQGGQAQGGRVAASTGNAGFRWFSNGAVDPGTGGGSSTIPPNVDAWANPEAGPFVHRQGPQGHAGHGNYFSPNGGYYPDMTEHHNPVHNSGENHHAGPMAQPGQRGPNMAGGVNQAGGNGNQAGGVGGAGGAGSAGGSGRARPIPNLPYNANDLHAGQSASSGAAAGTLVGVALAVIVVVGVFGGAAYILRRQRSNNHVVMANV